MSNNSLFDDIARMLASPMPRRQTFRLIAGGLTAGAMVPLLKPEPAYAGKCGDPCAVNNPITNVCGPQFATCPTQCRCRPIIGSSACVCGGKLCLDTTVQIVLFEPGPPATLEVAIQNAVLGLDSITINSLSNCTLTGVPVTVSPPVTTPFFITATKIDQTQPARFELSACSSDGCCPEDPIFTVLKLSTGRWVRQTFADVPSAERFLTVTNGSPGLSRLHIWVNSKHYATLPLRDIETRSLDLAAAMTQTNNTISLVGTGELGASAAVNIVKTPPPHGGATAASQALSSGPRHNPIWGPMAEASEENSDLLAANVSSQTVQIVFSDALSNAAASNSKVFTAEVNGTAATVQGAHVQGGAAGTQVILQLPQRTLHSGDSVDVYWENLRDAKGRPLSGHGSLFAH